MRREAAVNTQSNLVFPREDQTLWLIGQLTIRFNMSGDTAAAVQAGGDAQQAVGRNRIQVSSSKKPVFFYVNLAKVTVHQSIGAPIGVGFLAGVPAGANSRCLMFCAEVHAASRRRRRALRARAGCVCLLVLIIPLAFFFHLICKPDLTRFCGWSWCKLNVIICICCCCCCCKF